jgi:hypothetical protein
VRPGNGSLPDRRWALWGAVAGLCALASYAALSAISVSPPLAALLTFGFSFGFTVASLGLYLGVLRDVAPRIGLVAAAANAMAAVELTAMLLVQLAVKSAESRPAPAFTSIWLGLDVAWDVFGGAGTVLFGLALFRHPRFRPLTAGGGVLLGALLLVLNIGTCPKPPAEAGLFDIGPFVGLWYIVLSVRVLLVARRGAAPPTSA